MYPTPNTQHPTPNTQPSCTAVVTDATCRNCKPWASGQKRTRLPRYNEIALNWSNGAGPDSADLADLRAIASLCLDQGGRAVLDARALCAVWLHEFYADSEACTQSFAASRPWSVPSEPQPDLRLGPNPADDLLHLQLPDTDSAEEPCMLEIV